MTTAAEGLKGFDTNEIVNPDAAEAFANFGYRFVCRYIPRLLHGSNDLDLAELAILTHAGLEVVPVQHVESEISWIPTAEKGTAYGNIAGTECKRLNIRPGKSVVLDLEGVAPGISPIDVITYCNNWYGIVKNYGFKPCLYVGWHCGLNAKQLYQSLKFDCYWGAYNLNADERPIVRGLAMQQLIVQPPAVPPGVTIGFQVDIMHLDKLGGLPTL